MFMTTLILSMLLFACVFLVLGWARTPSHRLTKTNVIHLLEMVLNGQATENDWLLFGALPLRHNPALDAIRNLCMDVEEREYTGLNQKGLLFTQQGLDELAVILAGLREADC